MSAASLARLTRNVLRFPAGAVTRLDKIATQASAALGCNVSRSTVVRAVVGEWLDAAEQSDPAESLAVIRTAIVRRGRKRIVANVGQFQGTLATTQRSAMPPCGPLADLHLDVILLVAPYLLTLLLLGGFVGRTMLPATNGIPFDPEAKH